MRHSRLETGLRVASWIVLALLVLLVIASLLPLVESDVWWIRFLDFPRVQFSIALIVVFALLLALLRQLPRALVVTAIMAALLGLEYQAFKLHPYVGAVSSQWLWGWTPAPRKDLFLARFERLPPFDSDHYPIIAELCHAPGLSFGQVAPTLEPDDLEEAENTIAAAVEIIWSLTKRG